jgi:GGDEF domain-containing protein
VWRLRLVALVGRRRTPADPPGKQLRGGDRLARIGGDEFAVLLPDWAAPDLVTVAGRLNSALGHEAGCGIGTAVWRAGDDAAELMRRADAALYADKAAG